MYTWLEAAVYCEETFGVHVDMKEGFFECPDCSEPIYECDWDSFIEMEDDDVENGYDEEYED